MLRPALAQRKEALRKLREVSACAVHGLCTAASAVLCCWLQYALRFAGISVALLRGPGS